MALMAAETTPAPVYVVDSKGPTMSLGWQVWRPARLREWEANVLSILARIDGVRQAGATGRNGHY